MLYDNYIFDLYGTLVDIHTEEEQRDVWEKLALFYGYYDAGYESRRLQERFLELVNRKQQTADAHEAFPEIQIEKVFRALFEEKGVAADWTLAVHAGQFFRALTTDYIRLYEGVTDLLEALKAAGKHVFLLSNAQRIFTEYEMRMLHIADYFEDIYISSECGIKKPDRRFFEMLLAKYNLDITKTIMIGNDMHCDIKGAKNMGLHTFYIHSNLSPELKNEPIADYVLMEMDIKKVQKMLEYR